MRLLPFVLLAALAHQPAAANPAGDRQLLERMGQADANRDGNVSRPELLAYRSANFTRFDRNDDGSLSTDDIPSFLRGRASPFDFNALLVQFDTNRDNRVSRSEFVDGPTVVFDRADANGDGLLTQAERTAAIARAQR
jgi:Ca2+-binding EF-hand superfamily protein